MNFSEIIFSIFILDIYGLFLSIIFCVGAWLFYKKLAKEGADLDFFLHNFWKWCLVGLIVGRITEIGHEYLFLVSDQISDANLWKQYNIFIFFVFWEGGINITATLVGFVFSMLLSIHKKGLNYFLWLDILVWPLYLCILVNDLFSFLTGNIYGVKTDMFLGVQYTSNNVPIVSSVHPVMLYAFFLHLLILLWLIRQNKYNEKFAGKIALKFIILFLIIDFFLQFKIGNPSILLISEYWNFRGEHLFDAILIWFGFILLEKERRRIQ